MLSLAEKIGILRSVSIFFETPADALCEVAGLLEQVSYASGETIFEKGDQGNCMYLIIDGKVSVHDGDLILNHMGKHQFFGEMAVLDSVPRVASVTAVEDTRLLRLDQAPFYQLMENRIEVAHGIIRVLSQHLRARVRDVKEDYQYIQQMERITSAAAALEAGIYNPGLLDQVCERTDSLGQLARVFRRMAGEVYAREQMLRSQIQQLRIEVDEAKKTREVLEITESDYYQELQKRVQEMRKKTRPSNPVE
jgi:CRP/FNR family transcriptional regulator, cyclic AMP receptor protein